MKITRRGFVRDVFLGSAAAFAGAPLLSRPVYADAAPLPPSTVSFATGTSRRQMVIDALTPLKSVIQTGIAGKQIVIKPNLVYSGHPLCATHVDAIRGLLDILKGMTDQKIIIGESNASGDVTRCFTEYGYTNLVGEYNVELRDLNTVQTVAVSGFMQKNNGTANVKVLNTFLDKNSYLISICPPKSHNCTVATLTLKNLIMGAPLLTKTASGADLDNQKFIMHSGDYGIPGDQSLANNIFLLANRCLPSLAVVDGFEGMEGDGPIGEPSWGDNVNAVPHRIALAGTDALAVDAIGFKLMGVNPHHTYYAELCGNAGLGNYNEANITILGPSIAGHIIKYRMHRNFNEQIAWIPNTSTLFGTEPPRRFTPYLGVRSAANRESGARIEFTMAFSGDARLTIFNLKGTAIRKIVSSRLEAGRYARMWDGCDDSGTRMTSGHYIVTLRTETGFVSHLLSWR